MTSWIVKELASWYVIYIILSPSNRQLRFNCTYLTIFSVGWMLLEFEVEAALLLAVQPSCLDSRVARQGPAWLVGGNHFSNILTNYNLSSEDMELISRAQKSNLVESSQFSVAMRALWREFSIAISNALLQPGLLRAREGEALVKRKSFWQISLVYSPAPSGLLWLPLISSRSFWLFRALCGSHSGSQWLPLANYCSLISLMTRCMVI